MATDQFGGVLVPDMTVEVPEPKVDTFGGVLVEEPTQTGKDQFGGSLVTEDPDVLTQLSYGYESTPSFTENLALWAESQMPLGSLVFEDGGVDYKSPEELYGEDFMNADPDTRREMLLAQRQKQIETEYADVIASGKTDSVASTIGSVGGALTDITTLAPVGQTYKAMTVIGGLLGLGYSSADQLANKGEIDPIEAGTVAAVSAVATPVVGFATRQLGQTVSKIIRSKTDDVNVQTEATTKVDNINDLMAEAVIKGVPEEEVPAYIMQRANIKPVDFPKIIANSKSKIKVPTLEEAKLIQETKALQKDPVSARSKFPSIDNLFGALHTRIKNMNASVAGRLRKFEMASHVNSEKYMRRVTPFIKDLNKLSGETKKAVTRHLYNGNFDLVRQTLQRVRPQALKSFDETQVVLKDLLGEMQKAGYEVAGLPNYFPRLVKDLDKLRAKLSPTQNGMIEAAWKDRAKKLGIQVSQLPADEKALIANNIARGYIPKTVGTKLSFAEARTIKNVTDDLLDDYADPIDALHTYIRQTVHNVEKRKFFGKTATNKGTGIDLDDSIGKMITDEIDAGRLNSADQAELADLLQSRFGFGEMNATKWVQDARNVSYMTTIGNPISALTQLGDVGVATYFNGLTNTFKAIFGKKGIDMKDLGLEDHIAQEFVSTNRTGKFLNGLFKYSGFRAIDRFGKNTLLNGSLRKGQAMVKSPKGTQKLREKYGDVFGDEFDLLVNDLKAGKMTDNVKLYLWNELSDVQPISLAEMPKSYLDNPNGRIFYALKTFTLKQLDLLRNDIYNQIMKGNYYEGGKNLVRYFTFVPLMGATVDEVKDLATGRGFNPDEIPDNYISNAFKVFAVTEYARENALDDGKVGTFLKDLATPAILSNLDALGNDFLKIMNGDIESAADMRALRQLPGVGTMWYNFFGGGLEKWEEEQFKEQFKIPE